MLVEFRLKSNKNRISYLLVFRLAPKKELIEIWPKHNSMSLLGQTVKGGARLWYSHWSQL